MNKIIIHGKCNKPIYNCTCKDAEYVQAPCSTCEGRGVFFKPIKVKGVKAASELMHCTHCEGEGVVIVKKGEEK